MLNRRRAVVLVAWLAALIGMFVAGAPAASAHALLLRSEPSPQSTVPTAPDVVRLHFSEAVEVGPGDVRVFDVDGKRVDANKVTRSDENRQVDVAVPTLANGSYTLTWKVVSADTHAVRGGFVFYVGAPSTISPVAVDPERGAGRVVGYGYGVNRFIWYSGLLLLVGLVVVRRFAWTPALREVGLADGDAAARFRKWFSRALLCGWAALALAGVASLVFQAATVNGSSLLESFSGNALSNVLDASFGRLWFVQMGLTIALLLPVAALCRRTRLFGVAPDVWIGLVLLGTAGLCLVAGLSGHARTDPLPGLTVPSIAAHLMAVAVWVGGLAALVVFAVPSWRLVPSSQRVPLAAGVVRRFSVLAIVGAVVVAGTGVVNSLASFDSVADLWRYPYGRVVLAKIVLLAVALVLAARHRFVSQRRLLRAGDEPVIGDPHGRELKRFEGLAGLELAALAGALALAAALVAMVPGRTLALADRGPVNTEHRAGAYTVQLIVDPTTIGSNQVHLTYVNASGLAAGEVTHIEAQMTPPGGVGDYLDLQLIGPGHFVAETELPRTGRYRIDVEGPGSETTFTFTVRKGD